MSAHYMSDRISHTFGWWESNKFGEVEKQKKKKQNLYRSKCKHARAARESHIEQQHQKKQSNKK